jgi:cytoskeletal protein RodZ
VGSANGDRSASRRKKRRGERTLTSVDAGAALREARERLGIDLAEVHDRTGISWRNLEALESGDVQRFSDPSAAGVAMRRYADLVSLDSAPLIAALSNPPAYAYSGAGSSGSSAVRGTPAVEPSTGHLRRYHNDHSHLRSFTQTAEVPVVGGVSGPPPISGLNGYAHVRVRRKAPWFLRFVTWLALFLLILGAAGLAVDHYKPQWLRDIHLIQVAAHPTTGSHHPTTARSTVPTTRTSTASSPTVTTSKTGVGTVTVKVSVPDYTIQISTFGACWIQAQTPLSVNPLLNRTLSAGQSVSIPVTGVQISIEFGSLSAQIKVEVGGKPVQGWSLKPDAVPYFVTFAAS